MEVFLICILIIILFFRLYIRINKKPLFSEEEYILQLDDGFLYGSLTRAISQEPSPLVLIIPGSGPTDRDGNNPIIGNTDCLKSLASSLGEKSISSLRFDKRGIGKSKEIIAVEEDLIFEDYVEDTISWIKKIKLDNSFNKIYIAGHSEGALIGALAANQIDIDGYISISGSGYPAHDLLMKQLKNQSPSLYDESHPIAKELASGNLVNNIPSNLESIFRPSIQPYLISWFSYDPCVEVAKINRPLLILQGDRDLQIHVEDAYRLHKSNPNSSLIIIKGMNHNLKNMSKDKNPVFNETLVEEIYDFIKNN